MVGVKDGELEVMRERCHQAEKKMRKYKERSEREQFERVELEEKMDSIKLLCEELRQQTKGEGLKCSAVVDLEEKLESISRKKENSIATVKQMSPRNELEFPQAGRVAVADRTQKGYHSLAKRRYSSVLTDLANNNWNEEAPTTAKPYDSNVTFAGEETAKTTTGNPTPATAVLENKIRR